MCRNLTEMVQDCRAERGREQCVTTSRFRRWGRIAGVISIDTEERRRRLAVRHFLTSPGPDVATVAGALGGLHATDPATVYMSAMRRTTAGFDDITAAFHDERSLVRIMAMRRTLFVVPVGMAAVLQSSSADALAGPMRRRLVGWLEAAGVAADAGAWLKKVTDATVTALQKIGPLPATALTKLVPELGTKIQLAPGKSYGAEANITSQVVTLIGVEGRIVRATRRGSWVSGQHEWAATEQWLGAPLAPLRKADAQASLVRTWLAAFGPATENDVKWWTGWTLRDTRAALEAVEAEEVALDDGSIGYVLAGDTEATAKPKPWAALLPGLDPTTMGWKDRDWYLGPHAPQMFDRNGNGGPAIWWNGRIVGGWAQRKTGEIVYRLLDDIGAAGEKLVEREVAALTARLGDAVFTPRFPTPLDKELRA
jgi:hypothetical protein